MSQKDFKDYANCAKMLKDNTIFHLQKYSNLNLSEVICS